MAFRQRSRHTSASLGLTISIESKYGNSLFQINPIVFQENPIKPRVKRNDLKIIIYQQNIGVRVLNDRGKYACNTLVSTACRIRS